MLCQFTGGCACYGYACSLVDVQSSMLWIYACLLVDVQSSMLWICLFTGGCARYGYPCLLVDRAWDMPVYWWMSMLLYTCLPVDVHAMVCLFTGVDMHTMGMPVY